MKVLYIFSANTIKGAYLQQWISLLTTKKEIEIAIIFVNKDNKLNSYHENDILFIPFNIKNGKNVIVNYFHNQFEIKDIIKKINSFNPTIIHLHGCYNTYLSRLPLLVKNKFKFIFNVWGSDYNISFFKRKKYNQLITALFEKADTILTLWYSLEQKIKENSPTYAKKVKTIPWGIEKNAFEFSSSEIQKDNIRNLYNIKKEDFVLLSIKGLIPNSNQATIIEALSLINKQIPIKLIIHAPSRDEVYYKKLLKLVDQHKLKNKVIFSFKFLSAEQFKALCAIGKLSIIISSHDQFTRSLLEGIIEKSELIVSNILPFQLLNEKFNLNLDLVDPKNPIELAEKIKHIYSQRNNQQIKQERLNILKKDLVFENQFEKIAKLYHS